MPLRNADMHAHESKMHSATLGKHADMQDFENRSNLTKRLQSCDYSLAINQTAARYYLGGGNRSSAPTNKVFSKFRLKQGCLVQVAKARLDQTFQ